MWSDADSPMMLMIMLSRHHEVIDDTIHSIWSYPYYLESRDDGMLNDISRSHQMDDVSWFIMLQLWNDDGSTVTVIKDDEYDSDSSGVVWLYEWEVTRHHSQYQPFWMSRDPSCYNYEMMMAVLWLSSRMMNMIQIPMVWYGCTSEKSLDFTPNISHLDSAIK